MFGNVTAGSFPVFKVWDTQIRIHGLFVVWIIYSLVTAPGSVVHEAILQTALFGSVLLHEFGHVAGARKMGLRAELVILWPLGGLAPMERAQTAKAELVAVGGGPLVNLVLLLLSLGVILLVPGAEGGLGNVLDPSIPTAALPLAQVALRYLFMSNLLLFVFNVIPAYPMDGGALLRAFLWIIPGVSWRTATLIATSAGMLFAAGFVALAGLGGGIMLALIGVMIGMAAYREFARAKSFRALPTLEEDRMPHERVQPQRGDDRMPHER
jgi:Zn-dependent protease